MWPAAATYLQGLAREKAQWGLLWRLEHFTIGYESNSLVEGSFSAFQRFLGQELKSLTGVIQCHVQKDSDKTTEEKHTLVNLQMLCTNETLTDKQTDPANECAKIYSHATTERF